MKRWRGAAGILAAATVGLTACAGNAGATDTETEKETFVPEVVGTYEAEDAEFSGNVHAESEVSGYSGSGYAAGFAEDDDSCTFQVEITEDGFYDLDFISASSGDYKENYVSVDGESL